MFAMGFLFFFNCIVSIMMIYPSVMSESESVMMRMTSNKEACLVDSFVSQFKLFLVSFLFVFISSRNSVNLFWAVWSEKLQSKCINIEMLNSV